MISFTMCTVVPSPIEFKSRCRNANIYYHSCCNLIFYRGTLEGKRQKPEYDKLLEDPMLKYSGLCQDSCADLLVVCEVYDQNQPLALPVSTSYKAFTSRWK